MRTVELAASLAAQGRDKSRAEDTGRQSEEAVAQEGYQCTKEFAQRRNRIDIAITEEPRLDLLLSPFIRPVRSEMIG